MAKITEKAARLLYVALALVAFAVFFRFVGARLWPNARIAFMVVTLAGIVVLLVVPLAFPSVGFYRSDSLKKANEAMAREESESDS